MFIVMCLVENCGDGVIEGIDDIGIVGDWLYYCYLVGFLWCDVVVD